MRVQLMKYTQNDVGFNNFQESEFLIYMLEAAIH